MQVMIFLDNKYILSTVSMLYQRFYALAVWRAELPNYSADISKEVHSNVSAICLKSLFKRCLIDTILIFFLLGLNKINTVVS